MDETLTEAPRPRRAAEPQQDVDPAGKDPSAVADADAAQAQPARRARRAREPEIEDFPDLDDPAASADGPSAPQRTEWLAGPAEPTEPSSLLPTESPAAPTAPISTTTTTDDAWRPPGSASSPAPVIPPAVLASAGSPTGPVSPTGPAGAADAPQESEEDAAPRADDPPEPAPGSGAVPPGRGNGPSRALPSEGDDRRARNLMIAVVAVIAVIALVIAAVLLRGRITGVGPGAAPTPTPTATPALTTASLLTVEDVSSLDGEAAWAETLTQERLDADTPRPHCVVPDGDEIPLPQSTRVRKIQAGDDANTYVLHEAFQFATAADATAATQVWTTQLGSCEQPVSLLQDGWDISGVGDASVGVTAIVQDKTSIHHTVQVGRTGTVVHVLDAAKPSGTPDATAVAGLLGTVVDRTCTAAEGTCADAPTATAGVPPQPAENPEFLVEADLPRITPGTGRWGGTEVATSFDFFGSQCESRDLAEVSGPESRKQRAYLLQEDAAAPEGTFGIDEYLLGYPDKGGADTLVKDLTDSLNSCADRMLTATVEEGDEVKLKANEKDITGRTWIITQQVDANTKQRYRVAVVQVDRNVIYTVIPTGQSFDLSNEQWKAIAERAGERLATTL